MALKLTLKPGERVVIGGAVLRNSGSKSDLIVENEVPILREKNILGVDAAVTPARRLYFAIQLMYLDGDSRGDVNGIYESLLRDLEREAPSMRRHLRQISDAVVRSEFYTALKLGWNLIDYERKLLQNAEAHS